MFTPADSDLCLRTPDPASNDSVYMYIKHQCPIDIPTLKPVADPKQKAKLNSQFNKTFSEGETIIIIYHSTILWESETVTIIHDFVIIIHHCTHVGCILNEYHFIAHIFYIHQSGVLTALFSCCMAGATWNCCYLCASFLYTIQPCTRSQCHFIQRHMGMVHACLAVTCYLYFWWNNWDLLLATGVTQGWNTKIRLRASTEGGPWRRKSPTAPAGTWAWNLSIMNLMF